MKPLRSFPLIGALLLSSQLAFAGFDIPGSADGEDLGRPARPDPVDSTNTLAADPIGASTRTKMQQALFAKFTEICKQKLGQEKWETLTPAEKNQAIFQKICEVYNMSNGANAWQNLPAPQQSAIQNDPGVQKAVIRVLIHDLGCAEWDPIGPTAQERLLREKIVIEMIGETKWNELDATGKDAARADAINEKVRIARCNVATAIKFIACIPQPNPNPLGVPSGADVAACLQKTWEKKRLCIDFISKGAFGSILPNCAGKAAGCDPDNNPINIALSTFPCKKTTSIYDPDLYTLITTLYHEGIHALQVFSAKPARPGIGATQAEIDAYNAAVIARYNEMSENECVTHGAENILIAALCPKVKETINLPAVVDEKTNPYLTKVLECFATITDLNERKAAARAFKKSLDDNKGVNDGALACYNQTKVIFNMPGLTPAQKQQQILNLRWIKSRLNGRLVVAGGEGGRLQQWDIDPATGDHIDRSVEAPLDMISDVISILDGSVLLVVGSEFEFGDGIVLAYFDLDDDGFIDPGPGKEILRDFELFGPVDLIEDPTNGELLAVHLENGNIFAFFEGPGFENFDLLPDQLAPVGVMDLQPQNGFAQRIIITEDGSTIMGLPGFEVGIPPILLPGIPIPHSFFDPGVGEFVPQESLVPFELWLIPPVFVEANGLPVIDTTSVINQFTDQLLVAGTPGGPFGIQILPPLPDPPILIGPQTFGPDGRTLVSLPVPLQPGFDVELFIPGEFAGEPPFSIIYGVRDATPRLELPVFIPDLGFSANLFGIPGMEYQLFFSPDLVQPFLPIGDPLFAPEIPSPFPPMLPPEPGDGDIGRGFLIAQPVLFRF